MIILNLAFFLFATAHSPVAAASVMAETSSSGPRFSAFSSENKLYVTILADSCNSIFGELRVLESCVADRHFKNLALNCGVRLHVTSTKMACPDASTVPRVLEIPLHEKNIAPEAEFLLLNYAGNTIEVRLNRD